MIPASWPAHLRADIVGTGAEDRRELCRLCREGMLFEVQERLRSGQPVPFGADGRECPLSCAAGKGFHSLVRLLCDAGPSQGAVDAAFGAAAAGGNLETAKLLLQRGATAAAVDAKAVFKAPNVEIEGLCAQVGVDLSTGAPLARELIYRSEVALQCFERWHAEIETVRDQGAVALITHVREGDEWWVTRLIRAGANPRLCVTALDCRYEETFRCTALEEAARHGTYHVLLRLGVRKSDDLEALLKETCWDFDLAKMKYLLARGRKLNDRANGGSSLLQDCLRALGTFWHTRSQRERLAWDAIVEFSRMGARWVPDPSELSVVRCGFRHAQRRDCVRFVELMQTTGAADRATLAKLFGSPKMLAYFGTDDRAAMAKFLGNEWWRSGRRHGARDD